VLTWLRSKIGRSHDADETSAVTGAHIESSLVPAKQERPRVCLMDVDEGIVESLRSKGMNCFSGTLGSLVSVPNKGYGASHQCLLNYEFPDNLHEYDVVVIDLQNKKTVEYDLHQHVHSHVTGHVQQAFRSTYPETLFDPRPAAAQVLGDELQAFLGRETVCVIFAAENDLVTYYPIKITSDGIKKCDMISLSLYGFYPDIPSMVPLKGIDTRVLIDTSSELGQLLRRHNASSEYETAFAHPMRWKEQQRVESDDFIPLMAAMSGEAISYVHKRQKNCTFVFPVITDKKAFLVDLMERVLPEWFPAMFPYSTLFMWLKDEPYMLPNEEVLVREREGIRRAFEADFAKIDTQIDANHEKHKYLHDLLTTSGAELVASVETFLLWLGFPDVVNMDETDPNLREEDLVVDEGSRLLLIEVKGIGGTSTDADCAQISKVRYRRAKERNMFDVFGLYIVNHQRYLPPEKRENPPFSEMQIEDAVNDERGLLTTYELFKLHFNIERGLISKEDAREALFQTGLVTFAPSGCVRIRGLYDIHYKGFVVVFQADGLSITQGQTIVLDDGRRYRSAEILEIHIDGNQVPQATGGEVGIKLSEAVSRGTELWLRAEDLQM
jgi:hypothetical protein